MFYTLQILQTFWQACELYLSRDQLEIDPRRRVFPIAKVRAPPPHLSSTTAMRTHRPPPSRSSWRRPMQTRRRCSAKCGACARGSRRASARWRSAARRCGRCSWTRWWRRQSGGARRRAATPSRASERLPLFLFLSHLPSPFLSRASFLLIRISLRLACSPLPVAR